MACCSAWLLNSAWAESCVKTFRWTEDPPYTYRSESDPSLVVGIDADIVREVLSRLGCNVQYVEMPWARALVELEMGRVDIVGGAFDTPERRAFAYYSRQGMTSPNVLFMRKTTFNAHGFLSFSDFVNSELILGGQIGVNYGPEYEQATQQEPFNERLILLPQRDSLWRMLARGRLDGVIASQLTGLMEINGLGFSEQLVNTGIELSNAPSYFIFSKASVEESFVSQFDNMLQDMQESGALQHFVDVHTVGVPAPDTSKDMTSH